MDVAIKSTTDSSVRCIVIGAAGSMYSFGGDLKFFSTEMEKIFNGVIELFSDVKNYRMEIIDEKVARERLAIFQTTFKPFKYSYKYYGNKYLKALFDFYTIRFL